MITLFFQQQFKLAHNFLSSLMHGCLLTKIKTQQVNQFKDSNAITPTLAFFNMLFEKMHDVSWTYFPSCFGISIGTRFTTQLIFSIFCLVFAKFHIILNMIKKTPPSFNHKSPQMCVYITHWSNGCPTFAMCLWQWMYKNTWCNVSPNMQDILHPSFMRSTFTWDESNNTCFF
jgi:hypothetical protein